MSPRNGRAGLPDPEGFFDGLRPARQACIDQLRNLPPTGPHYAMMRVIIAALDVAAEFFTHRRDFFLSVRPDMIGGASKPLSHGEREGPVPAKAGMGG